MSAEHEKVRREVDAEVLAIWKGTEKVLLSVPAEGATFEAWAPRHIARHLSPGVTVRLFLGDEDSVVGWYLPDANRGVREDLPAEGPTSREDSPPA